MQISKFCGMKPLFAALIFLPAIAFAQGYVKANYNFASSLRDDDGNRVGKGDLYKISGRFTVPLWVRGTPFSEDFSVWAMTVSSALATLQNDFDEGVPAPDEILNASVSVSHVRSLSEHWSLITSLGLGLYSPSDEISMEGVFTTGACVFAFRVLDGLSVGLGAGLTTSYGIPMVVPMSYFSWQAGQRVEVKVEALSSFKASASARLGERWKVNLVAIEMDGMSAALDTGGESKDLYSTQIMRSSIGPEYYLSPRCSVFLDAGANWLRSASLRERSVTGFWDAFTGTGSGKSYQFDLALQISAGLRWGL